MPRLDLDDLRAVLRELLGHVRAGEHPGQVQHADTLEGPPPGGVPRRPRGSVCVQAQPAGVSCSACKPHRTRQAGASHGNPTSSTRRRGGIDLTETKNAGRAAAGSRAAGRAATTSAHGRARPGLGGDGSRGALGDEPGHDLVDVLAALPAHEGVAPRSSTRSAASPSSTIQASRSVPHPVAAGVAAGDEAVGAAKTRCATCA